MPSLYGFDRDKIILHFPLWFPLSRFGGLLFSVGDNFRPQTRPTFLHKIPQ
jgi:hypothetical protein